MIDRIIVWTLPEVTLTMAKHRFTAEQSILKLREAEVEQAKIKTIKEVSRKFVILDKMYYRLAVGFGSLKLDHR